MSGSDWLLGDLGKKPRAAKKIINSGELDLDAVEALMDSKKDGEAIRGGLDKAVSALDALRKTGLTGEALVLLIQSKCPSPGRGGHRPSHETVQAVLEGLFRLGEYVRE